MNSTNNPQGNLSLAAFLLLKTASSSGGDLRFSQTLERYSLDITSRLLHPRRTITSGRFQDPSSRIL
jgi:hypothetical protein